MPSAREDYLNRMHSFKNSLSVETIKSKSLTETVHNDIARLLRNGLAVVAFAALEDFIKNRTSEVLSQIGSSNVRFSELPEALQYAATYKAISALGYQIRIRRDKSDKVSYIQDHATKIASTSTTPYAITPHAFGYDQANLGDEAVSDILKAFFVDNPWQQITHISSRLNLTALPLKDAFFNAASRRNQAAHVASANIPELDLSTFVNESFGIAAAFDVLISEGLKKIQERSLAHLRGQRTTSESDIKFRFLRQSRGEEWKEFLEGTTRAFRKSSDYNILVHDARHRSDSKGEYLFVFNAAGTLIAWF